ncbi:hypothetical protein MTP03_16700 [Tsukamurella sp. PLM1]|nr:hypothetical protein MTP03_16700 [Tsukamurella sp. PLM1]
MPPRPPVQPYRPSYGPAARPASAAPGAPQYRPVPPVPRPVPQYRPVPPRPGPAAPPRGVPYGQWSMPAPAPYRSPVPQPAWAPAPPAAKGGGAWIAILLVTIVVLVAVLLGTAVVLLRARTGTEAAPPTTGTTFAGPTNGAPTSGGATGTGGATPSGTAALQGNPLFANASTALPAQACNATGWPSDSAAGTRFFASVSPCLDRAWESAMTATGLRYREPTVVVPSGTRLSSPCGTVDLQAENVAAFYCPSNETLYMPPQGLQVSHYGNQPVIYLSVFAHEYGHHVQLVSGVLAASNRLERQYGRTSDRALELSRRTELQAQCFAGLFLKSVSDTGGQFTSRDYRTAYEDQERGDPPGETRTHGTSAHAQGWWNTGYQTNRVARCNTWAASSGDVA